MELNIRHLSKRVIEGEAISRDTALDLLRLQGGDVFDLLSEANKVKLYHKGNSVKFCAIVNAKSGRCSENCSFCSQSIHHNTTVSEFPMLGSEQILEHALKAFQMSATEFGIVTSGKGVQSEKEINTIAQVVSTIKENGWGIRCASLGILSLEHFNLLKDAGLQSYHHNLETSREFFPSICTTHSYDERLQNIRNAKQCGFRICSGGVFGIGETDFHRIDLAFTLKELGVDSIPLNFLNPVPGTPAAKNLPLHPLKALKIIAVFRLINPGVDIRVCGGREVNLRSLQPLMYIAGANGALLGDYLTTKGRDASEDLQMISDLGLEAGGIN